MQLILMQGAPGSGKSTKAKELAAEIGAVICSTDDFYYVDGEYVFDQDNLSYYHTLNLFEAEHWLAAGRSVIIDNCNIRKSHAQPYLSLARKYGAETRAVRCVGEFQNVHSVPTKVVERMRNTMEKLT